MCSIRKIAPVSEYPPEERLLPSGQYTSFRQYELYDLGAYSETPLSDKITWKVTQPSMAPKSDEEQAQREKIQALMERIKKTAENRKHPATETNADGS